MFAAQNGAQGLDTQQLALQHELKAVTKDAVVTSGSVSSMLSGDTEKGLADLTLYGSTRHCSGTSRAAARFATEAQNSFEVQSSQVVQVVRMSAQNCLTDLH